ARSGIGGNIADNHGPAAFRYSAGKTLVSRFPAGSPPEALIPLGQGLAGAVAKSGRPVVVGDIASDSRSSAHPWLLRENLASFLGVPLKVGRRTVGVVEIFTNEPRDFSSDDI